MTCRALLCGLVGLFLAPALAKAAPSEAVSVSISGHWVVTADFYGTPTYTQLNIVQEGGKITGTFGRASLDGSVMGHKFHFVAKDANGATSEADGSASSNGLSATITATNTFNEGHPSHYSMTASLIPVPELVAHEPRRHDFSPSVFYRQFSALNKPVLTVAPGDTIHTTTIDAGGTDERNQSRAMGGNPQTGPFYIETALPGDTLVVHIVHLRLNRDWALSDDALVDRALDSDLAVRMKDGGKFLRWHLDLAKGLASLEKPGEHLAQYALPVHPMLGCIATAPAPAFGSPSTTDSGDYGGNMDFNEVSEGSTVYLPVAVPGALLYFGDAHALQGDGELNGSALETSMDVEVIVDVIHGRRPPAPRVESSTYIMAMGIDGSLDDAFRDATGNMAKWLSEAYHLTPPELAEVLATTAEYRVSEVADRNAGVVLKIRKDHLVALAAGRAALDVH